MSRRRLSARVQLGIGQAGDGVMDRKDTVVQVASGVAESITAPRIANEMTDACRERSRRG